MVNECPICGAEQAESLACHSCMTILERDLGDVPALVAELDTTISKQARIGQGGKGGLASERTPINVGASGVAQDLNNTLGTWARDVTGERTTLAPRHVKSQAAAAAWLLLGNIPTIRRHPAVNELFDEIADAIKQARRVVDRPADRIYLGQCMFEDAGVVCYEEIFARHGASEARCKVCGITHEVAERRAWLLKRAEDMLFTVREAAQMVGEVGHIRVTESAIRGYIHRGRIAYRAGTNTIRLGDLLAVVVDDGERRSA